jgi:uncharacterized protein HemY
MIDYCPEVENQCLGFSTTEILYFFILVVVVSFLFGWYFQGFREVFKLRRSDEID